MWWSGSRARDVHGIKPHHDTKATKSLFFLGVNRSYFDTGDAKSSSTAEDGSVRRGVVSVDVDITLRAIYVGGGSGREFKWFAEHFPRRLGSQQETLSKRGVGWINESTPDR